LPLGAALLAGCNTVPPTNVHQPMTARPAQPPENRPSRQRQHLSGGVSRTLFEDRRARYVGDTLTITIAENTSASTKSNSTATRRQHQWMSVPTVTGLPTASCRDRSCQANEQQQHLQWARVMPRRRTLYRHHHGDSHRGAAQRQPAGFGRKAGGD
jgi:flagellar basal body L-ring protein FlgH